jgi:hypothetical protein
VTLPLEHGERVLTWGRVAGGGIAAATDVGLRIRPGDNGEPALHRWHEITRATWGDGHLVVEDTDRGGASYRLTEPRGVPPAVREHVNATLVVSEHHRFGEAGVRVVARRNLRSGTLVWSAVYDAGVEPDEQLTQRVEELMAAARLRLGDEAR